jgi:hypothetical protein
MIPPGALGLPRSLFWTLRDRLHRSCSVTISYRLAHGIYTLLVELFVLLGSFSIFVYCGVKKLAYWVEGNRSSMVRKSKEIQIHILSRGLLTIFSTQRRYYLAIELSPNHDISPASNRSRLS